MSHVDEGALHAYLDGALEEYPQAEAERIRAHLDACAECAERLEAERGIRSDAHALLDLAAPAVEAPGFEELRAYVERTRPRKSRISHLQQLGWAASVVLALGAGWMIREGQLQSRALDVRQERVLAPAAEATPSADEAPVADGASPTDPKPLAATAPMGDASVAQGRTRAEADRGRMTAAADETRAESPEAPAPSPPTSEEPGLPEGSVQAAGRPAVEAAEAAMAGTSGVAAEQEVGSLDAAAFLGDSDVTTTAAGVIPTPDDTVAVRPADIEIEPTNFQAMERNVTVTAGRPPSGSGGRAIDSPSSPALRTAVAQPSFAPISPPEERVMADSMAVEPLLAVPGYDVVSVTNLGDGTTAWGVRVVQALDDGRRLEVVHLEPEIEPFVVSGPGEGWNEVRTRTERGWILLRGPLPTAELSALLGRIFPESR